jgi:Zn-dependent peptidase ImmA (M78 family)
MPRMGWARNQARKLLTQFELTKPPVAVEKIARQLGIKLVDHRFDSDISSLLVCKADQFIICVNESHHLNRRRFSVAHEIGHFMLHRDEAPYFHKDVGIYFRANSADLPDPKEVEANQFAAEILIPLTMIRKDLSASPPPTASELAKKYQVSEQAMTFRLASIRPE